MSLIRLTLFLLIFIPLPAVAYEGDYVWDEKFKTSLPIAEQGDLQAQYDIGVMYEKGRGTDRNQALAFKWYLKSAKQGNKKSAFKVGYGFLKGRGISKDPEKALKWLGLSANKGYGRAEYYIGEMYDRGNGVLKDYKVALKWYRQAQKSGFGPADTRVTKLKASLEKKEKLERLSAAKREKRQAEAAATNQQLAQQTKARAQTVSLTQSKYTTKELLLQGGWIKRNRPAEYLPSSIAKCKDVGLTIECQSGTLTRNIGMADISYQTKAVLFGIKNSGIFKISYQNNVLNIQITDPEFKESGVEVPVSLGWQKVKHSLACNIKNSTNKIDCKKNKFRKVKFTR